jgi:prephenate dehydratase
MQATAFLLAVTTFAAGPAAAPNSPETDTRSMAFHQCLSVIQTSAADLGVVPVNIVDTGTVRTVRFLFSDGSVQITCSAIGNTMAVTLSPRMCEGEDC